jgi:uncharacterized membrane protein
MVSMNDFIHKFWLKHPSTYVSLVIFALAAFMAQPTIASVMVFIFFLAPALILNNWLARQEGRNLREK